MSIAKNKMFTFIKSFSISPSLTVEFKAGERYTISVFACTNGAPVLLQRSEGYAIEQGKESNLNLFKYYS